MKKVIEDAFKKAIEIATKKENPEHIVHAAVSYSNAIQLERQTDNAVKRSNS